MSNRNYFLIAFLLALTPVSAQAAFFSTQDCMVKLDQIFARANDKKIDFHSETGMKIKYQAAETAGKCRAKNFDEAAKSYQVLETMIASWTGTPAKVTREGKNNCQDKANTLTQKMQDYNIPKTVVGMLKSDIARMEKFCIGGNQKKAGKKYKSIDGVITDMKGMGG